MTDLHKAAEDLMPILERWKMTYPPCSGADWEKVEALRQALAQPEQKPVAWGLPNLQDPIRRKQELLRVDLKIPDGAQFPQFWVPLYTAPPKREWVGLTDEEMKKTWYEMQNIMGWYSFQEISQAVEAKLKEKNT